MREAQKKVSNEESEQLCTAAGLTAGKAGTATARHVDSARCLSACATLIFRASEGDQLLN